MTFKRYSTPAAKKRQKVHLQNSTPAAKKGTSATNMVPSFPPTTAVTTAIIATKGNCRSAITAKNETAADVLDYIQHTKEHAHSTVAQHTSNYLVRKYH